jgi:hypothetical protein
MESGGNARYKDSTDVSGDTCFPPKKELSNRFPPSNLNTARQLTGQDRSYQSEAFVLVHVLLKNETCATVHVHVRASLLS